MEVRPAERGPEVVRGHVVVRFTDNEFVEGVAAELDLDRPDFELRFGEGTNNRVALVALPAVKSITLERRPLQDWSANWPLQKIAVHFRDGEVFTGLLGGPPVRRAHGVVLTIVTPSQDQVETIAFPHPGLKAVFFLKAWDGRLTHARVEQTKLGRRRLETPLVDLLGEIRSLDSQRRNGNIGHLDFERRRLEVLWRI